MSKCIILRASKPYSSAEHEPLLRRVLVERPGLFAVVGTSCVSWEDAMNWLCVDLRMTEAPLPRFCNTTSHTEETLDEVVAFAEQWCTLRGLDKDIRVMAI
jgi:hypothetical protein